MLLFTNIYIVSGIILLSILLNVIKMPKAVKLWILSAFSLVVLASLHLAFAGIILLILAALYTAVKIVDKGKLNATLFMLLSLFILGIILVVGKYGDTILYLLFQKDEIFGITLLAPLGITYFVIKLVQFVLDYRRGLIPDLKIRDMIAYIVFLPTFSAGPIENYNSFKEASIDSYKFEDYLIGVKRIVIGYFKKMIITDMLIISYATSLFEYFESNSTGAVLALLPLIKVMLTFLKAYFDLAAYSDIAIGYSRLLGFKVAENFDGPLWKRNISKFWNSWHMSLSRWCTTNIYFPVFGFTRKIWIGFYASMITMGMLHHVDFLWLGWGLHHATGLVFFSWFNKFSRKRKKLKKFMNRKPIVFISHLLTFFYVSLGYAFVGSETISEGLHAYLNAIIAIPKAIIMLFS